MKKRKLSELVLDFDLYPRNSIDAANVHHLREAMLAGVKLPPLVVDAKSGRIIDGFHRYKAYLAENGEDFEVDVIEKSYASEKEMFLDAVRYNASHGAKLDSCDRARCTIIAGRLRIGTDKLAGALNMPVKTIERLRVDRTATSGKLTIPIKRTISHFAGKVLNKRQEEANTRLSGMNQSFYANQLIELIEAGLLDTEDEKLFEVLKKLHSLLDDVLCAK